MDKKRSYDHICQSVKQLVAHFSQCGADIHNLVKNKKLAFMSHKTLLRNDGPTKPGGYSVISFF